MQKLDINNLCKIVCKEPEHESNQMSFICMREGCTQKRLCCSHCLIQYHGDHTQDSINLKHLGNMIRGKYEDKFRRIDDIQKGVNILKDKDLIDDFSNQIIKQLESIKVTLVQQIEQFKLEIPSIVRDMNELKRLSNFYDTFQKLSETATINTVLLNQFNFSDEKKVRDAIALYFS